MNNKDKETPHFVTSHDFHGDAEYIVWLQEIKGRYQRIRSRIALQANCSIKPRHEGCLSLYKRFLIAQPVVYETVVPLLSW